MNRYKTGFMLQVTRYNPPYTGLTNKENLLTRVEKNLGALAEAWSRSSAFPSQSLATLWVTPLCLRWRPLDSRTLQKWPLEVPASLSSWRQNGTLYPQPPAHRIPGKEGSFPSLSLQGGRAAFLCRNKCLLSQWLELGHMSFLELQGCSGSFAITDLSKSGLNRGEGEFTKETKGTFRKLESEA